MKDQPKKRRVISTDELTKLYIIALSLVALLVISGHFLVESSLRGGVKDAYLINVAGKQRMLSQKICKGILLLEGQMHTNQKAYLKELSLAYKLWNKNHHDLRQRPSESGLEGMNSAEVVWMFFEIEPSFTAISENVRHIIQNYSDGVRSEGIATAVNIVLENEDKFLSLMDQIVTQYEIEAKQKIEDQKDIKLWLLGLTLLLLLFIGLFIFRPAVERIINTMEELVQSENRTNEVNLRLMATQEALKKSNDELELKVSERTSEVLRVNEELKQSNEEMNKINRDLDNFIYTASHDLKSPINNIDGLINALWEEPSCQDESSRETLTMIKKSIARFRNVLKDLSDTGKVKMEARGHVSVLKLKDLLEEVKYSIKDLMEQSGASITEDFSEVQDIRFSHKNLRSILYNLLSNAVKYRSPDRDPVVRISSHKRNGFLLLKVEDNGIGIKQEDILKIFSMYTRVEESVEGTGLGLSIVKKIVDNNGGKIEVASEPGKGSTFSVYLKAGDFS